LQTSPVVFVQPMTIEFNAGAPPITVMLTAPLISSQDETLPLKVATLRTATEIRLARG
jgi:hypothetical protein